MRGKCSWVLGIWAIALLISVYSAPAPAEALTLEWVRSMGGSGQNRANAVATDSLGNVYAAGNFVTTVDFDPGEGVDERTSVGSDDIFVVKLDAAGNLVWARTVGGTGFDNAFAIAVDSEGTVYVTGEFSGTVDFDPAEGVFELSAPAGAFNRDAFVLKLDTDGGFVWARSFSGPGFDRGEGIAVDSDGNVYTVGRFSDTIDFDPGDDMAEAVSEGGTDFFVHKLDADGDFVWVRVVGGTGDDWAFDVAVDVAGNPYVTGSFEQTVEFDPTPGARTLSASGLSGLPDAFVMKLAPDGETLWAHAIGGTAFDQAYGIAVDGAGSAFLTGTFAGTVDFDPGLGTFTLTSTGAFIGRDIFVLKLDANGAFEWARSFGGASTDEGRAIAVDDDGIVAITGEFQSVVDFDPGSGLFEFAPAGGSDAFLLRLTVDGSFLWAGAFAGGGFLRARGIAPLTGGAFALTGSFPGTVDFDFGPGIVEVESSGITDVFLARVGMGSSVPVSLSGAVISDATGEGLPCAVVVIEGVSGGAEAVAVTDASGAYFVESVPADSYTVRVQSPGFAPLMAGTLQLTGGVTVFREFALEPAPGVPAITGRITDREDGWAIAGARVEVLLEESLQATAFTCADGHYSIPLSFAKNKQDPLPLEVVFSSDNYDTDSVETLIEPAVGGEIDAKLMKSVLGISALVGSVVGDLHSEPVPLAGARVTIRGPLSATQDTSVDGLYAFNTLLDGRYTVTASAPGFVGQTVQRTLVTLPVAAEFRLAPDHSSVPTVDLGDVNGDGVVNAVDVQLVINAALGVTN